MEKIAEKIVKRAFEELNKKKVVDIDDLGVDVLLEMEGEDTPGARLLANERWELLRKKVIRRIQHRAVVMPYVYAENRYGKFVLRRQK